MVPALALPFPEPTRALLAACLVGRPRRRNPFARRDRLRISQRLAVGMTPKEVARAEATDEAAIEGLLAQEDFRELVEADRALLALPVEEQRARLVKLARFALRNALADDHAGAALFVLREEARSRDPAETLAHSVLARSRRLALSTAQAPAAPRRPPAPARRYDPLDALARRGAASLRRAVVEEHAVQHAAATAVARDEAQDRPTAPEAPRHGGAAATRASAEKALALRAGAADRSVLPDPDGAASKLVAAVASDAAPASPRRRLRAAALPGRPRAP